MAGGEIAAAGKAIDVVGRKILSEDAATKDVLLRLSENMPEMADAARIRATRVAVRERMKLLLLKPFALVLGVGIRYFEDTFPSEMAAKTEGIPDGNLSTPAAYIAVPALHGLSYAYDEPALKEMYLNLLTTASDDRRSELAHPAYVEVIKQLSPREAKFLNILLKGDATPSARLHNIVNDDRDYEVVLSHLLPSVGEDGALEEIASLPVWVDNWQRLGLVTADYAAQRPGVGAYDWIESRPEYLRLKGSPDTRKLEIVRGVVDPTAFGYGFFKAVSSTVE